MKIEIEKIYTFTLTRRERDVIMASLHDRLGLLSADSEDVVWEETRDLLNEIEENQS